MKTRALLLAAAAVFLTAPAFAAHNDNDNDKKHQAKPVAEQRQGVEQNAVERRKDARADVQEDRADVRGDRNQMAGDSRQLDRKITRENIRDFRANATAQRRFHYGQAWNAPRGWRYTRYAYGQYMPGAFYGRTYWIINFGGFGLYAPPYGYQWIRYGNDAILVDVVTGEIIRVEYNNFY